MAWCVDCIATRKRLRRADQVFNMDWKVRPTRRDRQEMAAEYNIKAWRSCKAALRVIITDGMSDHDIDDHAPA